MSLSDTTRQRLTRRALRYKKAWLLAYTWLGQKHDEQSLTIPDYSSWSKNALKGQIRDLERDFSECANHILADPDSADSDQLVSWMAERFDQWQKHEYGLLSLSTTKEFEDGFGPLKAREQMEVPPYAEMLMQGHHGLAIRHPEYMLAQDLKCSVTLFRDAQLLVAKADWRQPPDWAPEASMYSQTLARSVVQTCFNLLESFISGLARAHVMNTPHLEPKPRQKLLDTSEPLRRRVLTVPRMIAGVEIAQHAGPFPIVFGDVKTRRDSFVHCEPGPQESKFGYVKESIFHDVSLETVNEAVKATCELVRMIWSLVYQRSGPRWLPNLADFRKVGRQLQLRPRR